MNDADLFASGLGGVDDFWSEIAAHIRQRIAETHRSPEFQRERYWYYGYHFIDIEQVLSTPEGCIGFHAGTLYQQCQQECETSPKGHQG